MSKHTSRKRISPASAFALESPPEPALPAERFLTSNQVAAIDWIAVTPATVVDWIVTGLVVPDETDKRGIRKKRLQLPARKVGGRWKVKESDAIAFIDRVTKLNGATTETLMPVSEAKRKREAEAAKLRLDKILHPWKYEPTKKRWRNEAQPWFFRQSAS